MSRIVMDLSLTKIVQASSPRPGRTWTPDLVTANHMMSGSAQPSRMEISVTCRSLWALDRASQSKFGFELMRK